MKQTYLEKLIELAEVVHARNLDWPIEASNRGACFRADLSYLLGYILALKKEVKESGENKEK